MKRTPPEPLTTAILTGTSYGGLSAKTLDGRPLTFALIDDAGNVIASGGTVERECWHVITEVHTNYLKGEGWLVVHSMPKAVQQKEAA